MGDKLDPCGQTVLLAFHCVNCGKSRLMNVIKPQRQSTKTTWHSLATNCATSGTSNFDTGAFPNVNQTRFLLLSICPMHAAYIYLVIELVIPGSLLHNSRAARSLQQLNKPGRCDTYGLRAVRADIIRFMLFIVDT